jgi:hypothetical protein
MLHDGYRGVDIQLKYDFESDQFTLFCDTYTNGSADFFLMINSTIPTLALPNDRFSIPFDGIPTFVRSSCLKKNQQSGRGSLISYRPKKSSGISHEWKIGIVHSIWYNQRNKSNHIELWEFLDVVDQDGIPSLLKCDRWESMLPLLRIQMYYLDEIELLFLNQVRNKITVCIFI